MRRSPSARVAILCIAGLALPLQIRAQGGSAPPAAARDSLRSCDGRRVTRIDIAPRRPTFGGRMSRWRRAAHAVGLHHVTTRTGVVNAFLTLDVGQICSGKRLAESERLLRDQPFIASASVRAIPDGEDGVAIIVETVDEVPVLVGGRTHGLSLQELSLGNSNVAGLGLRAQGYVERRQAYRNGYGLRLIEYAAFGRPYAATLEGFQHPLGYYRNAELAHPFYTDLQRTAWHVGINDGEEYRPISRVGRDRLNLQVQQMRWDASAIVRAFGTSTVALLGLGASGIRLTPASVGIIVSDTGLAPDTGSTLVNRYQPFRATRLGLLGGIRRVSFVQVRGFDGLAAQQDIASGVMTGLYAAHGIGTGGERDIFLSGGLYAGKGGAHTLLATVAQMEARRDGVTNTWDSMIGSGRAALYVAPKPGLLLLVDDRYSTGVDSRLPLQFAIGDRVGGILGYRRSSLAGARRNAARVEMRFSREAMYRNADLGVAAFGETGTVWAGDAPYGRSGTRSTVGVSLLAAYPTHSKRLYRADIGFPLTRSGEGAGKIEIRFSSEDRTNFFWREPDDVARARTGPVPTALFVTPSAR